MIRRTRQMKQKQESAKQKRGKNEFVRKFFVSLKRSPQNIPMVVLGIAFLVYSFNLTSISNTTARINTANMGQCEFVAMLLSILSFVCFMRTFPKRQKPNKIMFSLLYLMLGVMVFVDGVYLFRINQALTRAISPIRKSADISSAQTTVIMHIVFVAVCAVLLITLPLYAKALKKINTSIDVEGNGEMGAIDISGEDE